MADDDRYVNTNHIKYLLIDRISNMLGLPDKDMYNEANVDTFINSKLSVLDCYAPMTTNSPILFFYLKTMFYIPSQKKLVSFNDNALI